MSHVSPERASAGRPRARLPEGPATRLAATFALTVAACGGGVIQRADAPPPPPPGLAALAIRCEPADVEVVIDDAYAGLLSGYREGRLAVRPGLRRVKLSKTGCEPEYRQLEVPLTGAVIETHLVCIPE